MDPADGSAHAGSDATQTGALHTGAGAGRVGGKRSSVFGDFGGGAWRRGGPHCGVSEGRMGCALAGRPGNVVLHDLSRSAPSRAGVPARAPAWISVAEKGGLWVVELGEVFRGGAAGELYEFRGSRAGRETRRAETGLMPKAQFLARGCAGAIAGGVSSRGSFYSGRDCREGLWVGIADPGELLSSGQPLDRVNRQLNEVNLKWLEEAVTGTAWTGCRTREVSASEMR